MWLKACNPVCVLLIAAAVNTDENDELIRQPQQLPEATGVLTRAMLNIQFEFIFGGITYLFLYSVIHIRMHV